MAYNNTFFDNPPLLHGEEREKLQQLYQYLNTMSDKLNNALMSISIEQMTPETQAEIKQAEKATETQATTLKELIVKTAGVVRHEMDEIRARLQDQYEALSDEFGAYERNLESEIVATATGVLQSYHYDERIQDVADDAEGFQRRIDQYIFSGLIDEVNGKYGIAIGENVTAYDGQGNPYLNTARKTATFVMDELAFWQGETKLAWITDNTFHFTQGEVTRSMKMGNHTWMVLTDGSMGLISG